MNRLHLRHAAPQAPQPRTDAGSGDVRIVVDGGYHPDSVTSELGSPVRITFHREDASPCSEQVVFADFGVETFLPLHEDVTFELAPEHPGEYEFACAMGMFRGRLIVRASGEKASAEAPS